MKKWQCIQSSDWWKEEYWQLIADQRAGTYYDKQPLVLMYYLICIKRQW